MAKSKKTPIVRRKERKIIPLHNHPKQILASLEDLISMAEEEQVKNLFVDIKVLTSWALDRLPLVPPEKKSPETEETASGEEGH